MFYQVNGYHPGWKYPIDAFGPYRPPIYSWTHCPWCDHELPGYEYVMKKILDEGEGPE